MSDKKQEKNQESPFSPEQEEQAPRQVHDRFLRASLKNEVISKAMIRSRLPVKLERLCQWETFKVEAPQIFTKKLKETIADSIFSVKMKGDRELHCVVHLEHHTRPKRWIALYFRYFREKYLYELAHSKKVDALPLVYPVFIYQNKQAFPYSTDYYDLFSDAELAREFIDKPLEVLNVCQTPDEDLKKESDAAVTWLTLKYVFIKNKDFNTVCEEKIIPAMKELFERIPHEFDQLLSQFVNYIFKSRQLLDAEKFAKIMGEIDEKVEDTVLTLEQSIRQQGHTAGRAEGHTAGRAEGHIAGHIKGCAEERRKLTLRMLKNGVDLKTVAKITEQQPEEIDRILIKWKQEEIA